MSIYKNNTGLTELVSFYRNADIKTIMTVDSLFKRHEDKVAWKHVLKFLKRNSLLKESVERWESPDGEIFNVKYDGDQELPGGKSMRQLSFLDDASKYGFVKHTTTYEPTLIRKGFKKHENH